MARYFRNLQRSKKEELILTEPIFYKKVISETFQKILCNKGANFESGNSQILNALNRFWAFNQMNLQFPILVQLLSENGSVIPILDQLKGGDIALTFAEPHFLNKVSKMYITTVNAVIWRKIEIDDTSFIMREKWTDKYVDRDIFNNKENLIRIDNISEAIPEELRTVYDITKSGRTYHNLGVLPIGIIYNKPYFINGWNAISQQFLDEQTDIWNVRGVLAITNEILIQFYKELIVNKSRLIGRFTQAEIEKMAKSDMGNILDDIIVSKTPEQGTSGMTNLVIDRADPKLKEYAEAYLKLFQITMRAVGITEGETQTSNNKTAGEIAMINNNTSETLKLRRLMLQEQMINNIFDKVLTILDLPLYEDNGDKTYSFNIIGTDLLDESTLIKNMVEAVNAGLTTRKLAISRIHNTDSIVAETIKSEIDKEFKPTDDIKKEGDNDGK